MTLRHKRVAIAAALLTLMLPLTSVVASSSATTNHHRGHAARVLRPRSLRSLTLGFSGGADWALAYSPLDTSHPWAVRAHKVGAQMVRLDVNWSVVAPASPQSGFLDTDPASPGYNWGAVDAAVRKLTAEHFRILILVWGAPTWAEGAGMPSNAQPGTWKPNAVDFGDFAQAIATRYDGHYPDPVYSGRHLPNVRFWQAWNEPNIPHFLAPQWRRAGHRWVPESPIIYRRMQNAFFKAVKAVSKRNFVLAAGTAPYGNYSGGPQMQPVVFDRALFCVNKSLKRMRGCNAKTYLNAIDTHTYAIGGPNWHAQLAGDVAIPDVHKLVSILHAAQRIKSAQPAGRKSAWITEISWDTKGPDPHGVPTWREAHWLEQALYVLWRQGVGTVLWWQLVDAPPVPNYASTIQGGVYLLNGKAKPSATSYRFPFVPIQHNKHGTKIWSRSPASGTLTIQRRAGSHWRPVVRADVHANQVFELSFPLKGQVKLRARIGKYTSLPWTLR